MDAYETRRKEWEDLEVTRDELKKLTDCLKKEEFRKLLHEYEEEINDPENRKIYEKEIAQLEKERGVDVTFVNPEPGYVIKSSVNGEKKCFLNISKSGIVGRPTSQPSYEEGHRGLQWSIPYTLVPPRDDLDKKNVRCVVFDVVFHPDTIYLASKNSSFRDIVNDTAMDGVENNFKVKLDRKNIKFPKINFKGRAQPSVIRTASKEPPKKDLDIDPEIYQKIMSSYDEHREQGAKVNEEKVQRRPEPPTIYYKDKEENFVTADAEYVVPKFAIKHQNDVEWQDFGTGKDASIHAAIPKKLVVIVDLPLLRKASDSTLDVQERSLSLKSDRPAKYKLDLPLPYSVDADRGNAKFDPRYKKLTVTLPVIRMPVSLVQAKEDSGVDSDHNSPIPIGSEESVVEECVNGVNEKLENFSEQTLSLVTECETSLKDMVLRKENGIADDTEIRTSDTSQIPEPFMNPSLKYLLPAFTCNVFDNQLAVTINVKNVDPNSIRYKILDNDLGIHILLASVGAGFFPQHYSLCFKLHENSIDQDSVTYEPWDNNVVFTVALLNTKDLSHYFVGSDEEFMERKDLPTALNCKNKLLRLMVDTEEDSEIRREVDVRVETGAVVIDLLSNQIDSDDEEEQQEPRESFRRQDRKHVASKSRSVSESSGDELSNSCNSIGQSKGILKSCMQNFSRSMSESSADENVVVSSADFHYDCVHDINSESDCSSFKKTVRFNDVVSRQLFRSNSSILGQRKKNQRKLRNKKRAHERRMSESENSETEERDKYKTYQKNMSEQDTSDNVKSILNREKQSDQQNTRNIKIRNSKASNKLIMQKRKTSIEEESTEDTTIEINDNVAETEFKSDLIFDLDM